MVTLTNPTRRSFTSSSRTSFAYCLDRFSELIRFLFLFLIFPYYLRFCAARYIKLAISPAFERKLIYRIVSYRSVLLAARTITYTKLCSSKTRIKCMVNYYYHKKKTVFTQQTVTSSICVAHSVLHYHARSCFVYTVVIAALRAKQVR